MYLNAFEVYTKLNFSKINQLDKISKDFRKKLEVCANIFPFRVSSYVLNELIDWDNIPEDPIFQLTFPQPGMVGDDDLLKKFESLYFSGQKELFKKEITNYQLSMNPHPAGQTDLNAAILNGRIIPGMQHKYDETILYFPIQGQLCHSFCTYCFRWPQFVGIKELKFGSKDKNDLYNYIDKNKSVTDALITGGDSMIMKASVLEKYIEPLLEKKPGNLQTIRFGTKSLAYWPHRFLSDKDSDELMRLFERIVEKGYHLAIMAHFSHVRELSTPAVERAISRLKSVGAEIRCQAPLIKHVNDNSKVWIDMWKRQVALGLIPYYMFVQRDTGPKSYFELPLYRAYELFTKAYSHVSGLCRTVRGPSMSASPGKVKIEGIENINGKMVFVLKFVQARHSEWVNKIFFAKFDKKASWLDDLTPVFGENEFFYEKEYNNIKKLKIEQLKAYL